MNQEFSPATSNKTTKNHQIAFVDIRLSNYETIVAGLIPTMQVVLLDGSANGLQTILNALKANNTNGTDLAFDAVHLFSHGSEASLQLGSSYLNINTLNWSENQTALDQIGAALNTNSNLFIYACDLAQGSDGLSFVENLAQLTHLNVSASNDATGASRLGGDWDLEVTADANGHLIQNSLSDAVTPVAAQLQSYDALLAAAISATSNVTVATGHDFLSATPATAPLNVQGAVELSNGTRVVLLANTHEDYYGMANLDYLQIASVDSLGNVSTSFLSGTVATVINNNGGNTHDNSFTQTNDGANIVALTNGFVVTSYSNDGYGVQMYNNSGVSQNISAPATYTSSVNPNSYAIATADGGFILLWTKNNYQELDFQRYNSSGTKVGSTIATTFTSTTPNIQGAAVDANGNLAIPVSTNDVYTHSQVMLWNSSNTLTGTYNTAFYQTSPVVTAMYGGGFDLFGNDIGSGVGNTASSYYVQSLALDGSLSLVISAVVSVAYIKSVKLSLSGDYFVVGGADSSVFDGYSVSGFNPSAGTTSRIVNDPTKLVVAPTLGADGDVTGAWATSTTTQENGFITDGTISTVTYSAAYSLAADMPPTIAGSYVNNGSLNDNATAAPFAGLTVSDIDSVNGSLTITYNSANGTLTGTGLTGVAGNYVLNVGGASFASLSSNLHNLIFHPTANQVTPGASVLTTFTITPSDGIRTGRANTFTNETALSINDAPVIDSNGGGVSASINPDENQTAVTTVHATDPDFAPTITYSKSGTDAALFNLNTSTGQLTFISTPNFEAPADANHDNVYNVTVTASDGTLSDSQVLTITVQNVNEAPVISSNGGGASASISVAENQTAITTVVAADVDAGTTLTYSVSGTDAALFDINSTTGVLTFKNAPNFESPADNGGNNVYDVIVTASDGALTDTQAIAITVTNVNEAPVINSNGGGASAAFSVAENQTATTTAVAADVDAGSTLTYSISGTDAALFSINSSSGVLTFKNAPNFESPADNGSDNTYDLTISVSDGVLSDTQAVAITVTNVNEAPVISSNGGGASASVSVAENQTAVTTVVAADVDASTTLSYSISGTDAALFEINSTTGVLTFKNAPNFESPADSGGDNIYDLVVTTSDGVLTDTQAIAITVTNVNEAPVISNLSAADNQTVAAIGNAVLIDQGTLASVSDTDNANFNGGTLTIALASGRASGDVLSILSGAGVTLSNGTNVASNISVGGQIIGTIANNGNGSGSDSLILNLTAQATPARVSSLLQNITFDATGTQGDRVVNITLNDGALDSNIASVTLSVITNPTVSITSSSNTFKAGESATITFTFSEAPLGFSNADITLTGGTLSTVTVDGGNSQIYTATFTPTADTQSLSGAISIAANTFTNAALEDNLASVINVTISGDTLLPTISNVARQTPNVATTNASTVSYAVSFSENVTGVDVSDFTLTKTGTTTGSISGITGSGSSYVVTVNGISGDGTLRLDLNSANTNILDAASNQIAGGYSSGQIYTLDQPAIHTASYDATTGILVVTGKGMVSGDTIVVSKLSLSGQNGDSYTLTSNNVTASSTTSFSVSLNTTDKLAINGLLNKNGNTAVDGTSFNLAATINWDSTIGSAADTVSNTVTVTNLPTPTISSASYNASTHVLSVSGNNLVGISGVNNDITVSKLSLRGEGGTVYTLTSDDVEVTDTNGFSITLNTTDRAQVETIFNKNGFTSTGNTSYNLAAADDWNSVIGNTNIAVTTAAVSVSNVPVPTITSSSYDAITGILTVTGTGFSKLSGANNDITANKFRLQGEGGASYTLTNTSNVEITSGTSFALTLSATDRANANLIMNSNGLRSTSLSDYNLIALEDWNGGADGAIVIADLTANPITVSNVLAPTVTSATYNIITGVLLVSGNNFLSSNGATNDILANHIRLFGQGATGYTLTDTPNVDVTSNTSFTITMSAADKAALALRMNKNGSAATDNTIYNISMLEDWNAGAESGVTIADLLSNPITVTGVAPTTSITATSFSADTGTSSSDYITNTANQTIMGTLSANLVTGESVEVSTNNGTSWSTANATIGQNTWQLSGATLSNGTTNFKVRVVDTYRNVGPVYSQSYTLDTVAPTGANTSLALSADSGNSSSDFITNIATQTISGKLNNAMLSGEILQVSLNNGSTWNTANTTVGLNTWSLPGQILSGNNTLKIRLFDTAGNAGPTTSQAYKIDTTAPTLASAITMSDTMLKIGETATVTFAFTEVITGFTTADLSVENGVVSNLASANGGLTWTGVFTANANVTDSTNLITLNLAGLADIAGNAGVGTVSSPNYAIDNVRPTLASAVTISDTALKIGDSATVVFTFTEAVTDFTTADLTVENAQISNLVSTDGGITWTANLIATANIIDSSNKITINLTGITDTAGNTGTNLAFSPNYGIETVRPNLASAITISDTALKIGDTATVTFTFTEAITDFTSADLTVENATISNPVSGNGGITWTATLTANANVTDTSNLITLNKAGIQDLAGNAGIDSSTSGNYTIDTLRPTATITLSDNNLIIGDTALVTISFSEPVTDFSNADLSIANGSLTAVSSSDGGTTWTASFTPSANVSNSSNLITLNTATVNDLAGNAGNTLSNSTNYSIDTIRPTLASAITISDTALKTGETATVGFTFNEAVTAFTTADVEVANGILSGLRTSDGGIHWTATLTPTTNIDDTSNLLSLDLTGLKDIPGNAGTGSLNSTNYAIDTRAPTATITISDDYLIIGDTSLITFTFSEAVSGFSNADLSIPNGSLSPVSSNNGGLTWTATYTPSFGIADTSNLITLDTSGVNDAAGNAGTVVINSPNFVLNTVNTVPVISGSLNNQAILANTTISPFSQIVITDPDAGAVSTVTINIDNAAKGLFTNASLNASGFVTTDGGATYTHATTTPANIQTALRALVFQPAKGRVAVGQSESTTFTLSVNDGYALTTDNNTHVAATAVNLAPTDINLSSYTVAQSAGDNFTIGDLSTLDINPADSHRYSIVRGAEYVNVFGIVDNHLRAINPATLAAGTYPITIRSTDAGGLSFERTFNIEAIDTVAPTILSFNVENSQSVDDKISYLIRFSEPVTGIDLTDFSLIKTGNINASLDSITSVDTSSYLVTIRNISGNGNLQLNLIPQHGIKDLSGRSLASSANSSLYSKDVDLDKVSDFIESQVPNRNGQGTGDGNGDSIQDSLQNDVSSLLFGDQSQHPTYVTVWNSTHSSQSDVKTNTNVQASGIDFPYGWLSLNFEGLAVGGSTTVSLLINDTKPINGYWKKDVNGNLVNIADSITTSGNNTLITFTLTDGDRFDLDGLANGRIVDPGVPGFLQSTALNLDKAVLATVAPRNAESLNFKVTFSDAVSHVDISDFKLIKSGNANGVISGIEKLSNSEYLVLVDHLSGDGSLALDLNKTTSDIVSASGALVGTVDISAPHFIESQIGTRSNSEKIAALYTLMYHRAPDQGGLNYWLDEMAHGKTMTDISRAFAGNARFMTDYASMSNQQFVETMYQQGLGNQGDASGIGYWAGKLNQGQSRPDMLAEFALASITADLVSAHKTHALTDAEYLAASVRQNALLNRIDLGLEFVQKFGVNSNPQTASDQDAAYYAAKLLLSKVDATDEAFEASLNALHAAHTVTDVQALVLTSLDLTLTGVQTEIVASSFLI
ncbi:Ig-like domain-containing protein [Undibacterium flavidum]|uniref:DUF4347 domain-containing protein n=1 Tax=Undibacterium flavidum TaxID=2762297 RepID=A0ABR6YAQ9_9BURK|nr:Ig-like domain-containing protein [Undibacterium flavidum]MBC3873662.1 DUF4347 domain-containing protein [Undibacterium flavidum]